MPDLLEPIASEREDESSDLSLYRINAFPADYTLKGLHDKWVSKDIVVPPFQRRYVWTPQQASRLVESFLLGLPVPGIFFYKEPDTQKLLVIDGQQRLKSVFSFFDEKFSDDGKPFYLKDVRPEWNGKSFSALSDSDKLRFKDAVLRATIIDQKDPDDNSSIFHIFERLNTGGVILKPQEIRNCICTGKLNDLFIALNINERWREILGQPRIDQRMRDVELIARFFALLYDHRDYKKPMKDFLTAFMKHHRNPTEAEITRMKGLFEDTVNRVHESLGKRPFSPRAGLNAAIFDSIMVAFALNPKKSPKDLGKKYKALLDNEAFKSYVTSGTTDVDSVKHRIQLALTTLFH